MRPLIWTDRRAALVAAAALAWLVSIELGTSRTASRSSGRSNSNETVVDTTTGRLFDVAALTAVVGGVAASVAMPDASIRHRRAAYLTGVSLLAGAGGLSVAGRRHLGRFHRDSLTVHADHELVESGPYRRVRHPLYTATLGVFVGIGAALGNWISLGLAALPAAALTHRIRVEERMLVDALGDSYAEYRRRTDRLVPHVWQMGG